MFKIWSSKKTNTNATLCQNACKIAWSNFIIRSWSIHFDQKNGIYTRSVNWGQAIFTIWTLKGQRFIDGHFSTQEVKFFSGGPYLACQSSNLARLVKEGDDEWMCENDHLMFKWTEAVCTLIELAFSTN